jgi:hypothetical protein
MADTSGASIRNAWTYCNESVARTKGNWKRHFATLAHRDGFVWEEEESMTPQERKDAVDAVLNQLEGSTADLGEVLEYLGLQKDHEVRRLVALQSYKCADCKLWTLRRIGAPCKPPARITPDWKCASCRQRQKTDNEWALRKILTQGDVDFLWQCGICWDAPKAASVVAGTDVSRIVALLREWNEPITRENVLSMAYMGEVPEEIDPEFEAELPSELQRGEAE